MLDDIRKQAADAAAELLEAAHLKEHDLVVIGCSSSEIAEYRIGSHSSEEIGEAVYTAIYQIMSSHGIDVAAQCCEHLNRALILEAEAAARYGYEPVNVVPQLKAGGSFATAAYHTLRHPVAVEHIQAAAGMHLKAVAVPVRIATKYVGAARVVCARTRPKFIGGERAHYNPELM